MKLLHSRPLAAYTLIMALASLSSCAKDPSKDAPAAVVTDPAPEPAAAEAAKPAETAPVAAGPAAPVAAPAAPAAAPAAQPAGAAIALTGSVAFTGSKVTGSHTCTFKGFAGTATLVDGKAEGGSLAFTVPTGEFECDKDSRNDWTAKLENHLKSDEFFAVASHPDATFQSTEIKAGGEGGASHTVKGHLTLRGTRKEITFPATIAIAGKDVSGRAEFTINRKDFGIEYPGKPDDLIRDGVVLKVEAKGTQP